MIERGIEVSGGYHINITYYDDGRCRITVGNRNWGVWVTPDRWFRGDYWRVEEVPEGVAHAIRRIAERRSEVAVFEERCRAADEEVEETMRVWGEVEKISPSES